MIMRSPVFSTSQRISPVLKVGVEEISGVSTIKSDSASSVAVSLLAPVLTGSTIVSKNHIVSKLVFPSW